jgi:hypothetical protein
MAILTAQSPLTGGGDMATDLNVGILDALSSAKGAVKLSVDPTDPLNPIAWAKNDSNVEVTTNKVIAFGSPTDTQYPSALLVSTQLGLKANKSTISPGIGTKLTYNADGIITFGDVATTADIGEVSDKRYVTDSQHAALLGLSGTNTGDQDLSLYALQSSLDTTNAALAGLSGSLSSYALASDLANTNATVAGISANLSNYALSTDLDATNASIDAINADLVANYTPLTMHNALQANFDALVYSMNNPDAVPGTAYESKLTFTSGLTRTEDTITNDAMTNVIGPNLFLGNRLTSDGVPSFVQPAAENLANNVTGNGKVVLDTLPTIGAPTFLAPATVLLADSGVSTSPSIFVIEHDFVGGGSIVQGFGATLEFRGRSSNTSHRTQGAIRTVWTNAIDGSRISNIVISPVFNGVTVDTVWIHGDGSVAIGANVGNGTGLLHASGGFSTTGVGVAGNVLIDNGQKFVPGKLDASYIGGQFSSCPTVKSSTTDQTGVAEQAHVTVPIAAGATAGTVWKVMAWGNMDQGSGNVQLTCRLRWGGLSGVILVTAPLIQTPNQSQTNQPWRVEFTVIITGSGTGGTARGACLMQENLTSTSAVTVNVTNSGATDVGSVNTTITTTMVLTWAMNSLTGSPHIRTFGAFAELIARPTPSTL